MKKSSITARFSNDVKDVWQRVTDNENWSWRSDLAQLEVLGPGIFAETDKEGRRTIFRVTAKEYCRYYAFDMEGENFTGHWSGRFYSLEDNGCKVRFNEEIRMKKPVLRLLSIAMLPLKKMQENYLADLKKALGEHC